ncbi:MAG: HAMP domain-containing histidine kinase [Proteobacteria bacterium]|uniref:sensor histidine kinase n=1 Tax=Aquabacterium sp. TaxID=1872578 RepID=UPI0035C71303|nr:HAMP domain-containing histidine kinase [Pseudomonadota bacterium]
MSRYVVPPPTRSEPLPGLDQTRADLTRWLSLLAAIGCMLVWWADERAGLNSTWASIAVPLVSAVLCASAIAVWWRPRLHNLAAGACTLAAATYFIGSLVSASLIARSTSLYEVATNAQFMPTVYLGAFVTLSRGAATLSWLSYLAMLIAYAWLYGIAPPHSDDTLSHFWFALLLTHPVIILALSYIGVLHSRLSAAERESQSGRERFLAMLSHEIRTPLQSMLGSIDLLDLKVRGEPERRAIDRLRQVSGQLEAHLRDVTEYTRLDNPAWQLHPQPVDLPRLVQDSCDTLQPQARARGLQLHCHIAHEPRLQQALTDPTRVRQVLDNLLHNALKYTSHGGITVTLAMRPGPDGPGDDSPHGDALALSVQDTGIGIAAEALTRIFEPYVRLEERRLPRAEGTGLGLAVVHRLVDRLGGQLEVDSTPEHGSCFTVVLPLRPAEAASEAPQCGLRPLRPLSDASPP